tara:strand:- start:430 stop:825 length:396 start_codon:yes stop_codon:yes gene_type:complete
MREYLVKHILTQFKDGRWGFATKPPARQFESSSIMGRSSTFNTKLGSPVSKSFSPVANVEHYIFLDDELQSTDSIKALKDLFKDGAYIMLQYDESSGFIQVEGSEPLTLDDVKAQSLTVADSASTQPSMAS